MFALIFLFSCHHWANCLCNCLKELRDSFFVFSTDLEVFSLNQRGIGLAFDKWHWLLVNERVEQVNFVSHDNEDWVSNVLPVFLGACLLSSSYHRPRSVNVSLLVTSYTRMATRQSL